MLVRPSPSVSIIKNTSWGFTPGAVANEQSVAQLNIAVSIFIFVKCSPCFLFLASGVSLFPMTQSFVGWRDCFPQHWVELERIGSSEKLMLCFAPRRVGCRRPSEFLPVLWFRSLPFVTFLSLFFYLVLCPRRWMSWLLCVASFVVSFWIWVMPLFLRLGIPRRQICNRPFKE